MHPRAIEAFLNRLLEIVNNITILTSSSDWHDLMGHKYVSIGEGAALIDDNIARFDKLFELIWNKLRPRPGPRQLANIRCSLSA